MTEKGSFTEKVNKSKIKIYNSFRKQLKGFIMEWFLLLIIGITIVSSIIENVTKKESEFTNKRKLSSRDDQNKKNLEIIRSIKLDDIPKNDTVEAEIIEKKENRQTVINNHYTQNVYVQQNNIYEKSKSKNENSSHTEKVWKRLGYRIKYGEIYSSNYFGNKLFTPNQVEKVGYCRKTLKVESNLSKNQKKVKQLGNFLVNKHGSKRKAKDILVDSYGFDERTAKYAAGYTGYDNW